MPLLGKSQKENLNELLNVFYEEMTIFRREFKKNVEIEKQENELLKKDLYQLSQDKLKLKQGLMLLEERVSGVGADVGFNPINE